MKFQFEAIIGDRYESIDHLDDNEIYNCLMNMQKQDILNVKTKNDYWEDVPQELFELFKNNIKNYIITLLKYNCFEFLIYYIG